MAEDDGTNRRELIDECNNPVNEPKIETTRRDTLKKFSVLPSLGLLGYLRRDTEQIVLARNGDEPVITKEVDKQWRQHVLKAERVNQKLKDKFLNKRNINAIGITKDSEKIQGKHKMKIKIRISPDIPENEFANTKAEIPRSYSGIQITSERGGVISPKAACKGDPPYFDKAYNELKGGIEISTQSADGTAACCVVQNGTEKLLTANHNYSGSECVLGSDQATFQGPVNYSNIIYNPNNGSSINFIQNLDAALVPFTNRSSSRDIIKEGPIHGHISKAGMSYLLGKTVEFRGRNSCAVTAPLEDYDVSAGCPNNSNTVNDLTISNWTPIPGDSGGPVYYEPESRTEDYMIGHVSGGIDCGGCAIQDYCAAPAAYALHNNHNVDFTV